MMKPLFISAVTARLNEHNSTVETAADWDTLATVAIVSGNEVSGAGVADATTLARYGRHVGKFDAGSLGTGAACDALGAQHVSTCGHGRATYSFTTWSTPRSPDGHGPWDYSVGDVCTLEPETPAGRIVEHVRIINRTLRTIGPGLS